MTKKELLAKYRINNGGAVKALLVSSLCVLLCLLCIQVISLVIYGPTDSFWPVCLCSTGVLHLINVALLFLQKRLNGKSILILSWSILLTILLLLLVYPWTCYPQIVTILPLLCIVCAYVSGFEDTVPLLIICVAILIWLSFLFGLGSTAPTLIFCVIGGIVVGKLRDRFNSLELAIRIVANGRSEIN